MSAIDLWAAAVTQSAEDLRDEPYESTEYYEAEAFFFHGGPWGQSRREVADQLRLHENDLSRLGRAVRFQRYAVDGGPPPVKRPVRRTAAPLPVVAPPPPAPVPYTPPVVRGPPPKPQRKPRPVHDRNWWIERFLAKQAA